MERVLNFRGGAKKKAVRKSKAGMGKAASVPKKEKTKAPKKVIIQNMCEDEDDEYEGRSHQEDMSEEGDDYSDDEEYSENSDDVSYKSKRKNIRKSQFLT